MPLANGFLAPADFDGEYSYDLRVGFCPSCSMVQLTDRVDPGKLFHENYAYYSSTSQGMIRHFQGFAREVQSRCAELKDPIVIEIGCNDGILLRNFARDGIRHLGVEPSKNVAEAARRAGATILEAFFNEETAAQIVETLGPADCVCGANVICHIPDLRGLLRGVRLLLRERGVFIFEEPYLADILEKTAYDQIYDEHVFYFSITSLKRTLEAHSLEIVDVSRQEVHGGSMRFTVARTGALAVQPSVTEMLRQEKALGLEERTTYNRFAERVLASRFDLMSLLTGLKGQGRRMAGYGATSKSTTVTNFCGIGPRLLDYISDTTAGKQGKFTPGTHVPVVPYERFVQDPPDFALLFAWNHAPEIFAKEDRFRKGGGKFIVYVPSVQIV